MVPTPQEQRRLRLKNDYQQMERIRSERIDWEPSSGSPPHVEAYRLDVEVPTIVGPGPDYRSSHEITVELPSTYPRNNPDITMLTEPPPYHPNWYSSGRWCYGNWQMIEGLGQHVVRMLRTLLFDPSITRPNSPANAEAARWYRRHVGQGRFPIEDIAFPDPTTSTFEVESGGTDDTSFRVEGRSSGSSPDGDAGPTFRVEDS